MKRQRAPLIFSVSLIVSCALFLSMCNNGATNTPACQSGTVTLSADYDYEPPDTPDAYLDLDTGTVGNTIDSDIKFIVSGGSDMFNVLYPVNGALASSMGVDEPGFDRCKDSVDSLADWNIPEVFPDNYLCVLTNQGRLAQLQIDVVNPLGPGSLQVSFTIWEETVVTREADEPLP